MDYTTYGLSNPTKGGTVYYDPSIGYYYREQIPTWEARNTPGVISEISQRTYGGAGPSFGNRTTYYKPVPISGFGQTKQTAYTPPSVDFNSLPNQVPAGIQVYGAGTAAMPYQRPTRPTTQPQGTGYRPQFDPTFIQQMLAQRFGNNQGSGIPTATRPAGPQTITPAVQQTYGGYQGQGGLGALRAMGNRAPAAPAAPKGGNPNAPV